MSTDSELRKQIRSLIDPITDDFVPEAERNEIADAIEALAGRTVSERMLAARIDELELHRGKPHETLDRTYGGIVMSREEVEMRESYLRDPNSPFVSWQGDDGSVNLMPRSEYEDQLRAQIVGGQSGQLATPVDVQAQGHEADNLSAESAPERSL